METEKFWEYDQSLFNLCVLKCCVAVPSRIGALNVTVLIQHNTGVIVITVNKSYHKFCFISKDNILFYFVSIVFILNDNRGR